MDFKKLTTSDWLIGGGGLALFIFSFFPWFGASGFGYSISWNGWSSGFLGWAAVLLGMVLVAYVVAFKLLDAKMPEVPLPESLIVLIVAGVCAVFMLLRLAFGATYGGVSLGLDRKFGLFLAVLAALATAAGAFLQFREAGMPTSNARGTAGGSSGGSSNTPPTPF